MENTKRCKCQTTFLVGGCHHSSVDSSAPTLMPSWVGVPSTPSTLFSFIIFVLYLSCEKNENKQKEAHKFLTIRLVEIWNAPKLRN